MADTHRTVTIDVTRTTTPASPPVRRPIRHVEVNGLRIDGNAIIADSLIHDFEEGTLSLVLAAPTGVVVSYLDQPDPEVSETADQSGTVTHTPKETPMCHRPGGLHPDSPDPV